MKPWVQKSIGKLTLSLNPPSNEPNELDWKGNLSADTRRIADHLMAFANYPGGGTLVFGVDRDANLVHMSNQELDAIANRVANIGRDSVEPSLQIDHEAIIFAGKNILLVHIAESDIKPVHRRGKPFDDTCIRSGGTTRKAERHDVGKMLVNSRTPKWESSHASILLDDDDVFDRLLIQPIFKMTDRPFPEGKEESLAWLESSGFIERHPSGGAYITNLGAICIASDMNEFSELAGKTPRVIVYEGLNRVNARHEKQGIQGYAVAFGGLLKYVQEQLPSSDGNTTSI